MIKPSYRYNGFTIVELLIVIVVITILMSMTAIGYESVQRHARNAQTASAVIEYRDALTLYRSVNRAYPAAPAIPSGSSCLGKEYKGNVCWGSQSSDPALTNLLEATVGGKLNMPASARKGFKGAIYVPITTVDSTTLDGVPTNFIAYAIEGDERCPVGPVTSMLGSNPLTQSAAKPASGQTISVDSNGTVQCWISLPNK